MKTEPCPECDEVGLHLPDCTKPLREREQPPATDEQKTIGLLQEEILRLTAELKQIDWAIWGDDKPANYDPNRSVAIEQLKRWAKAKSRPTVSDSKQLSKQPPATDGCHLCDKGFPINASGYHYGTQRLGMIENTPCKLRNVPPATDDKQEWTAKRIIEFLGLHSKYTEAASFLADAINAALDAEREKADKETEAHEIEVSLLHRRLQETEQQLLSAQAAIAKHNKCRCAHCPLITVELSALERHDREQWKLLIDGQHRAICGKCGYPELIGSDDCRNCGTNFANRFGYSERHDAEVRKPMESKIKELQDEIDRLNAR